MTGALIKTADFDPGSAIQNLTSISNIDIFFAKYDASGNYIFAKNIGGVTASVSNSTIAVDGSGNIYLTGYFKGTIDFDPGSATQNLTSVGYFDIFFAKYSASGNYVFTKSIGGINGAVYKNTIAIDGSGNIYLSGLYVGSADFDPGSATQNLTSAGELDIFFAKYDVSGNYIFAKGIGGTTAIVLSSSIVIDGSGNIYLSGFFKGVADFDPGSTTQNLTSAGELDIFFAKYDVSGNYVFAKSIGGTTASLMHSSIKPDGNGNIFMIGALTGTADFDPGNGTQNLTSVSTNDIFLAKYDASGNYVFAKSIGGASGIVLNSTIVLDGSGNIYIPGTFMGTVDFDPGSATQNLSSAGELDIFFAKYNASGNYIFVKSIGGASAQVMNIPIEFFFGAELSYLTKSLALDGSGNIYITGYYKGVADFDPGSGVLNLTSVGRNDIFFAKYNSSGTLLTKLKDKNEIPILFELSQNYPNPFNPSTTIRFGLPNEANVKLEIYNSLGQLVKTLIDEKLTAHYFEVNWNAAKLPSGLYFYKLTAIDNNNSNNKFVKTMKMMLMK